MRKRAIIIVGLSLVAVVIILALALGGVFRTGVGVDAAQVRVGTLEVTLPATGTFETRGVDLTFEIPGRLAEVAVTEGSAVVRGAVLAFLEASDLQAAAEQADAAAAAARSDAG